MSKNQEIMSEETQKNPFTIDETNDSSGSGVYFIEGGIKKVKLTKVEVVETTTAKGNFLTLEFTVTDGEGLKTHVDKLFAPKQDDKFNAAITRIGNHVKHIWEQFAPMPASGSIVNGATDTKDFFNKIAAAFNTGKEGKPIFAEPHALYWKMIFNNGSRFLSTPMFPTFCERISDKNKTAPKLVQILGTDVIELPKAPSQPGAPTFTAGGANGQVAASGDDLPF